MSDCHHLNVIADYSNGHDVCTDCGLVLQPLYLPEKNIPPYEIQEKPLLSNATLLPVTELLDIVKAKFHLPVSLIQEVLFAYRELPPVLKRKNDELAAVAYLLYQVCVKEAVPRSRLEICSMFYITLKQFNNFELKYNANKSIIEIIKPSQLLPRLIFPINIPHKILSCWASLADQLYLQVASTPASVLAFVVYKNISNAYTLVQAGSRKRKLHMTMTTVADICRVSTTSIKRLNKSLRGEKITIPLSELKSITSS